MRCGPSHGRPEAADEGAWGLQSDLADAEECLATLKLELPDAHVELARLTLGAPPCDRDLDCISAPQRYAQQTREQIAAIEAAIPEAELLARLATGGPDDETLRAYVSDSRPTLERDLAERKGELAWWASLPECEQDLDRVAEVAYTICDLVNVIESLEGPAPDATSVVGSQDPESVLLASFVDVRGGERDDNLGGGGDDTSSPPPLETPTTGPVTGLRLSVGEPGNISAGAGLDYDGSPHHDTVIVAADTCGQSPLGAARDPGREGMACRGALGGAGSPHTLDPRIEVPVEPEPPPILATTTPSDGGRADSCADGPGHPTLLEDATGPCGASCDLRPYRGSIQGPGQSDRPRARPDLRLDGKEVPSRFRKARRRLF